MHPVEPSPVPPDRYDWLILNALSDDYESVEQIVKLVNMPEEAWPDVTPLAVIDRVERLYRAGHLFLTLDAKFDRDAIVREIDQTSDRKFWFGRTPSGDALWEKHSAEHYPE
jgi:hypothetical protein